MNIQRKISPTRLNVVDDEASGHGTSGAALSPGRDRAIERWRGESPLQRAPVESEPAADAAPASTQPASKQGGRKFAILGAVLVALALGGGYYGYNYWTVGRFAVSTDDAYVRANNTTLAAKVAGYVSTIVAEDNAPVRAGTVIATLDDGDYRLAVDSAREKVASQQATVDRFGRQVVAQRANVEQARAQFESAQAAAKRASSEYDRQKALAGKEFASQQSFEQALANRDQSAAAVRSAQAAIDSAVANVDVLAAQQQEAARTLEELKTAQQKAERDLSFTEVRAPIDGVMGNRAMQVGDFVQTGQRLASLVPLKDVYIDANFKETQLSRLRPGQPVSIRVDALPGEKIEGVIESVAPASGAVFSLLPPDNATGNFTKIVQRLPVRIRVASDVAALGELRPGMSVVANVNTKDGAVASVPTRTRLVRAANQ